MTMNRVQFQPGLSMAEFLERYGSDEQCEAALIAARWPSGFACPACGWRPAQLVSPRGPAVLPVHRLPPPVQRHQRHDLRGHQAAADALVPGHAPADPVQEQRRRRSSSSATWAFATRPPGSSSTSSWRSCACARTRRQLDGRVEIDDAYLGGERSGGKTGRGSENKVPFVAAVQTTAEGQPQFVCLRQQPFTTEAVAVFAARRRSHRRPPWSPTACGAFGARADRRRRARARRHRRRQGQHRAAAVQGGQHLPGQPQARPRWHLPRLRFRQVRPSLPRRGPVPIQPSLQSALPSWLACCAPLAFQLQPRLAHSCG